MASRSNRMHTLNSFERDELVEIIDSFYEAVNSSDAYDDSYRNAMAILGVEVGEDDEGNFDYEDYIDEDLEESE